MAVLNTDGIHDRRKPEASTKRLAGRDRATRPCIHFTFHRMLHDIVDTLDNGGDPTQSTLRHNDLQSREADRYSGPQPVDEGNHCVHYKHGCELSWRSIGRHYG